MSGQLTNWKVTGGCHGDLGPAESFTVQQICRKQKRRKGKGHLETPQMTQYRSRRACRRAFRVRELVTYCATIAGLVEIALFFPRVHKGRICKERRMGKVNNCCLWVKEFPFSASAHSRGRGKEEAAMRSKSLLQLCVSL